MSDKYILGGDDGHTPIPVDDLLLWARWMEECSRRVAEDHVGPYRVSTVFLGLDHNFSRLVRPRLISGEDYGPPILFETMVFASSGFLHDEFIERYSTWDQAVAQHEQVVARLKQELSG